MTQHQQTPTQSPPQATTAGSVFARLGERSLATTTPQVGSTFGSLQADKEPAAPTFTFGKPEEKKEAAAPSAPSAFLFGAASKDADAAPVPAASGGFSFGKPSAPTEQPPSCIHFWQARRLRVKHLLQRPQSPLLPLDKVLQILLLLQNHHFLYG
ncbi:hypothetical protein E3U43_010862 [Larimichthys crocea]|uniref:Uncharacterized protein n=1 Tax=Larimichthys crocea TaxID=215358 RepID=A0ACD3RGC0_LARCR|nr:hypothetical protein E3U43_010862 [Larimichthys crocea]